MAYDERTAERVRHLLADRADVAEKKMMGGLAFMVKGGMCCAVSGRGGLLARVGADAATLAKEPHVKPMRMAGRVVKNFVRVMPEGYRTPDQLKKWIERCVAFTTTLPVKRKPRPRSG
jgi:hypothetical protein